MACWGGKDLMAMKVTELKEELSARNELVTGNKACLRRRLHAAIVSAHVAARERDRMNDLFGSDSDE